MRGGRREVMGKREGWTGGKWDRMEGGGEGSDG